MELTYTRAGDYVIPNIVLSQTGSIGHYGRLRRDYLKEHRPVIFNTLVLLSVCFRICRRSSSRRMIAWTSLRSF